MLEATKVNKTGFGYSIDNPIKTMFIPLAYTYLNNLRPKEGFILKYERVGSFKLKNNPHFIDKYKIYVLIKNDETGDVDFRVYAVWIDSYSEKNSTQAPEDFVFKVQPNW